MPWRVWPWGEHRECAGALSRGRINCRSVCASCPDVAPTGFSRPRHARHPSARSRGPQSQPAAPSWAAPVAAPTASSRAASSRHPKHDLVRPRRRFASCCQDQLRAWGVPLDVSLSPVLLPLNRAQTWGLVATSERQPRPRRAASLDQCGCAHPQATCCQKDHSRTCTRTATHGSSSPWTTSSGATPRAPRLAARGHFVDAVSGDTA